MDFLNKKTWFKVKVVDKEIYGYAKKLGDFIWFESTNSDYEGLINENRLTRLV